MSLLRVTKHLLYLALRVSLFRFQTHSDYSRLIQLRIVAESCDEVKVDAAHGIAHGESDDRKAYDISHLPPCCQFVLLPEQAAVLVEYGLNIDIFNILRHGPCSENCR